MTLFWPDLSHWDRDRGVRLQPDTVAVVAKATQGRTIADPAYGSWRSQAADVGALFGAYHWLNHGNLKAQAAWCFQHVGPNVPLMIDAEDVTGNTGYTGLLTVADVTGFTQEYRDLGGTVTLVYLPRWYWQRMGSPNLVPLDINSLALVSSNYTSYSDSGPGWQPYGNLHPAIWQYTDKQPYGGATCDFNAYRGTVEDLRALIGGTDAMAALTTDDPGWLDTLFRVDSMLRMVDPASRTKESNELAKAIRAIVTDVAAIKEAVLDARTLAEENKAALVELKTALAALAAKPPLEVSPEMAGQFARAMLAALPSMFEAALDNTRLTVVSQTPVTDAPKA